MITKILYWIKKTSRNNPMDIAKAGASTSSAVQTHPVCERNKVKLVFGLPHFALASTDASIYGSFSDENREPLKQTSQLCTERVHPMSIVNFWGGMTLRSIHRKVKLSICSSPLGISCHAWLRVASRMQPHSSCRRRRSSQRWELDTVKTRSPALH